MEWEEAQDVRDDLHDICKVLGLSHIDMERIFCYRTDGSKARAYARTWAFPKIFQRALNVQAAYVIEVISRYYDKLDTDSKKKVLIHELLHIPKNFSGALLPHHTKDRHLGKTAHQLFKEYKKKMSNV
ncbi:MAG: metallopeptidase [Candidatus Levybacteria bacterium]|nr:metallopeptidase [Candidatus Levybacteria bacterium]